MNKFITRTLTVALSIISVLFTFVPEDSFKYVLIERVSEETNIILVRCIAFAAVWILTLLGNAIYLIFRRKVVIKGKNYTIVVKYGDIFKTNNSKKVIPFDECFSTTIGDAPHEINRQSICGQYLLKNPDLDIQSLIANAKLNRRGKSQYNGNDRYESGRLLINGDYLLMAFAKLDKNGLGKMTRKEYLESLEVLWEEIDKYYGQQDVCIPILGSGVTRIDDNLLSQQDFLDIIIESYKLSTNKIHTPAKLIIACKKREDFSLNHIGESL